MRKIGILRLGIPLLLLGMLWIAFAAVGCASSEDAVWPETPGTDVQTDGKMVMDCSHMADGYVMICVSAPTNHMMKLRVTFNGGQLMYDINNGGQFEAFPLQLGSGKYEFAMFENVKGSKFSAEGKITLSVKLNDENAAYLVPNQYVNYARDSLTVLKSDELCGDKSGKDVFETVRKFIADEFSYDFVRAKTISSGTLPEVDPCFEKRAGICQDLAAVTVCMLRVQGIPARLVIGYADGYYHAWTTVIVNGEEIFFDPTEAVGAMNAKKYAIERMY